MLKANDFFRELINSGWQGAVCETGLGVPVQDGLLRLEEGGASKVLKYGWCPYSREMQPETVKDRSVSRAMAVALAEEGMDRVTHGRTLGGKFFSLAITGAYKRADEHGDTHGWVAVSAWNSYSKWTNAAHFWVAKGVGRSDAIDMAGAAGCAVLSNAILGVDAWRAGSVPVPPFDVFEGIHLEDHLASFCSSVNPLVRVPGTGFVRAKDWLRRPGLRIFRGSFNPPHTAHEEMGSGALWALDFKNARKDAIEPVDMANRLRMVELAGAPALVTSGFPRFVDFHKAILSWGALEPVCYVVGEDTMEAVVDPKHCDGDPSEYLAPLGGGSATFEVYCESAKSGDAAVEKAALVGLEAKARVLREELASVRSTSIRAGEAVTLSRRVAEYIKERGLYRKK